MCWLTETYHNPCGHWGKRQIATSCPCASSKHGELQSGCWNSTVQGVQHLEEPCPSCRYRESISVAQDSRASTVGGSSSGISTASGSVSREEKWRFTYRQADGDREVMRRFDGGTQMSVPASSSNASVQKSEPVRKSGREEGEEIELPIS